MRRLYFRIYAYFIGILVLFGIVSGAIFALHSHDEERHGFASRAGAAIGELLPAPGAAPGEVQETLGRVAERLGIDAALFDDVGNPIASAGAALPAPDATRRRSGWLRAPGRRGAYALRLPDGRWLVARDPNRRGGNWVWMVLVLLAVVALGAYPLARRITRRIERLRGRVDALGGGDLGARVEVEGSDEVADLARSFNRAAARIERLVESQRTMLASASHELRSPLARIRMAVELLAANERPELRAGIERDVAELDALIEELLLATRLETEADAPNRDEDVDLLALTAEACRDTGLEAGGDVAFVRGSPPLLRHLVRNLVENARRHGGASIEVTVRRAAESMIRLSVCDDGPGVPEAEHERVFEPFYRPEGTPETGEGVGLGLHLVRRIARRHGGDARCLPREGGGTCFVITLPGIESGASPDG